MKKEPKHLYEGMYIFNSALADEARHKLLEKVKAGITDKGGEIHKVFDQGRKRLASPVNKKREGYYFLLYFSAKTDVMEKLFREYRLNEDILRFMTVQTLKVPEKIEFQPLPE
jgi:small subunit ribosomal protein S6